MFAVLVSRSKPRARRTVPPGAGMGSLRITMSVGVEDIYTPYEGPSTEGSSKLIIYHGLALAVVFSFSLGVGIRCV